MGGFPLTQDEVIRFEKNRPGVRVGLGGGVGGGKILSQ